MITIHIDYIDGTEVSYTEGLELLEINRNTNFTTNCLSFFNNNSGDNVVVVDKHGRSIDRNELMSNTGFSYTDREMRPGHNIYKMLVANSFTWKQPKDGLNLRVIGSGGAFDSNLVNSSFIVNTPNGKWLVDCGYNVFGKLKELEETEEDIIKDLNKIFITHMDDDHIGSLKTLLYYRYFIHGLSTEVYVGPSVYPAMKTYIGSAFNFEMHGYSNQDTINQVPANIVSIYNISYMKDKNLTVISTSGVHHTPTHGIMFMLTRREAIWISGDTVANKKMMDEVLGIIHDNDISKVLLLHDYSNWDEPNENVHACAKSIRREYGLEYGDEFADYLTYYHNNTNNCMGVLVPDVDVNNLKE